MAKSHPPLRGDWLIAARCLYNYGPTSRVPLRQYIGQTNRQFKVTSKLLNLSKIISIEDGIFCLTPVGIQRYEETMGIRKEPPQ